MYKSLNIVTFELMLTVITVVYPKIKNFSQPGEVSTRHAGGRGGHCSSYESRNLLWNGVTLSLKVLYCSSSVKRANY